MESFVGRKEEWKRLSALAKSSGAPVILNDDSTLSRYCIADNYLQFYYKFIKPIESEIQRGFFQETAQKNLDKSMHSIES